MGGTVLIIWQYSLLWLGKDERGRGSQIGGKWKVPFAHLCPSPTAGCRELVNPLQSGDSHCPPEEEGVGAPRW